MSQPRILLFDIETMAALVYTWRNYNTNVIATEKDWYMLGFAYKWVGDDEVQWVQKVKEKGNDRAVVTKLWQLFDEADIVVAHNGDSFDVKMANARFIELGMAPPSPYQTIDTKKEVARKARNYSNKLDELGRRLGFGRKLNNLGFETWLGCADGDDEAWAIMKEYGMHDVELLEDLYEHLLPWIDSVNMSHWAEGKLACKRCGSDFVVKRGFHRTNASVFQTVQCRRCGGYSRLPKRESTASVR